MTGCAASSTTCRGGIDKWEATVGSLKPRVCLCIAPTAGQFAASDGNLSIQSGLPSPVRTGEKGKRVAPYKD